MQINLVWDADAAAAPQSFRDSVQAAADILDGAILDPITVNIEVGYGLSDPNTPLDGEGLIAGSSPVSYSALRNALGLKISPAALSSLPDTSSSSGQTIFAISSALEKAFGGMDPSATAIDGTVGFDASLTGDALTGAAVSQLVQALGLQDTNGDMALFAYTSPGTRYLAGTVSTTPVYFSLDGGTTNLGDFSLNTLNTALLGQLPDVGSVSPGATLSSLDLAELNAVGFDTASTPAVPPIDVTVNQTAPFSNISVALNDVSVPTGHSVSALSMVDSVSLPTGDTVGAIAFDDAGGAGYFMLDGVVQPNGQLVFVMPNQLQDLTYVAGPNPGPDTVGVTAFDYTQGSFAGFNTLNVTATQATAASIPASDFNGDGTSDLLFQNVYGTVDGWLMGSNDAIASSGVIDTPQPSWHVIATGDFDGDGKSDVLVQNDEGSVGAYIMDGLQTSGITGIADPGPSWHAIGTGDFDGDGKSDILFQNDDGTVATWTMNGTGIESAAVIADPGPTWHAIATGDFNGDGTSDIVFQSDDGSVDIWTMSGGALAGGGYVANPGTDWRVVGTGDFDGDGKSDLLLQNQDGTVDIWTMNGTGITGAATVADPGPSWHAIGTGDFNGDGKSDITFQNDDGTVAIWNMNGTSLAGASIVANTGPGWHMIGQGAVNFINGTQGTTTLTGTIQADDFVFTTFAPGAYTIAGFDPGHDVISLDQSVFPGFAAVQAQETQLPGGVSINLGGGSSLLIANVTTDLLSAKNFV